MLELLLLQVGWVAHSYGFCSSLTSLNTHMSGSGSCHAGNKALFILLQGDQVIPIKAACVVYWGWGRASQIWRRLILQVESRISDHSDLSLFRQTPRSKDLLFQPGDQSSLFQFLHCVLIYVFDLISTKKLSFICNIATDCKKSTQCIETVMLARREAFCSEKIR